MAENIIPIYSGPPDDFHWVGFGSGSGTNLRECSKLITPAMVFSDRPKAGLLTLEELADVPKQVLNGYKACGSWKKAKGYPEREAEYEKRSLEFNEHIVETLRRFEREVGYNIDLIVLGGYMRMVKEPLLTEFKDRMINVHPSELNLDHDHQRQYTGDDAVYDVLNDNYPVTRSSVIIVDQGEDHGEILVQGPELEVWEEFLNGWDPERQECIREYADAHQSMLKVRSDWPALTTALRLISQGRMGLGTTKDHYDKWRTVYVDEAPMGYAGLQIDGIGGVE